MDDRNNYHTIERAYVAIRVPQVDGNPTLKRAILAGVVSARRMRSQPSGRPQGAAGVRRRRRVWATDGLDGTGRVRESSAKSKKTYLDGVRGDSGGRAVDTVHLRHLQRVTASRSPSSVAPNATSAVASTTCRSLPPRWTQLPVRTTEEQPDRWLTATSIRLPAIRSGRGSSSSTLRRRRQADP